MTHAEYNVELQDMQRFVLSVGMQDRLDVEYCRDRRGEATGSIWRVAYQVFWGRGWVTLGDEYRPMTSGASYEWRDIVAVKLKAEVVGSLV